MNASTIWSIVLLIDIDLDPLPQMQLCGPLSLRPGKPVRSVPACGGPPTAGRQLVSQKLVHRHEAWPPEEARRAGLSATGQDRAEDRADVPNATRDFGPLATLKGLRALVG